MKSFSLRSNLTAALFSLLFATHALAVEPAATELIRDPHFQYGFILLSPGMGKKVPYGSIPGPGGGNPQWSLAQWDSRFPLQPSDQKILPDGSFVFGNPGKRVVIGKPGTDEADLSLAVYAGTEYLHPRQKGEPWPHLLTEQPIQPPLFLDQLSEAKLHIDVELKSFVSHPMANYSPNLHAAHIHVSFIVQNRNRQSPGFGKYYWFILNLYDDRYRFSPEYGAKDVGSPQKPATGMFIYSPPTQLFMNQSAQDKTWVTLQGDLLPYFHEGLAKAWKAGFLQESKSPDDYALTSIGLGWEISGSFDVDLQLKNFSFRVKRS